MADTLTNLSNEAQKFEAHERWAHYRNVRYKTAEHIRSQGNWKRAGALYIEVLIFDLQGVSRAIGSDSQTAFNYSFRHAPPAVTREVARFAKQWGMDESKFRTIYDRVADQVWQPPFPRSKNDVWQELKMVVDEHRSILQLEEKIQRLGPHQLLSEEEAQRYADVQSDYDILHRVEEILEPEPPSDIPIEKCNRAALYLGSVDRDQLTDRWKAKAYRRAGEVTLSRGSSRRALEYLEKALQHVDPDDRYAVKHLVKRVHNTIAN